MRTFLAIPRFLSKGSQNTPLKNKQYQKRIDAPRKDKSRENQEALLFVTTCQTVALKLDLP